MEVKWFVEDVWIRNEADLITIKYMTLAIAISTFDIHDWAAAGADVVLRRSACIRLINWSDLVIHVEDKEAISLLIHKHNVIFVFEQSILIISMRHPLKSFSEFLLSQINKQFSFVFFVEVLFLHKLRMIQIFRPIANPCGVRVFGSSR